MVNARKGCVHVFVFQKIAGFLVREVGCRMNIATARYSTMMKNLHFLKYSDVITQDMEKTHTLKTGLCSF